MSPTSIIIVLIVGAAIIAFLVLGGGGILSPQSGSASGTSASGGSGLLSGGGTGGLSTNPVQTAKQTVIPTLSSKMGVINNPTFGAQSANFGGGISIGSNDSTNGAPIVIYDMGSNYQTLNQSEHYQPSTYQKSTSTQQTPVKSATAQTSTPTNAPNNNSGGLVGALYRAVFG